MPAAAPPARRLRLALAAVVLGLLLAAPAPARAADLLLLETTATLGDGASVETDEAAALGLSVDVVSANRWLSLSRADFASYRAIILGDPSCVEGTVPLEPALRNRSTWSPVVSGNVIVAVTDPVFHVFNGIESVQAGARTLINRGIRFAAAEPGRTGLYLSLSCYYQNEPPGTRVAVLDEISGGGFLVGGPQVECANDTRIVATHPALDGLDNAALSNWGCSTHGGFGQWPFPFEVLALSADVPSDFIAPDGTRGAPYIVARGVEVRTIVQLSPTTATAEIGTTQTVSAEVSDDGLPIAGAAVTFAVVSGPHTGTAFRGSTNADGRVTFSYTGRAAGADRIVATLARGGTTFRSNFAERVWVTPPDADGDGVPNARDNCAAAANADQADADGDGTGDACEPPPDRDGDGIADAQDNCPDEGNPDQADGDADGVGDACAPRTPAGGAADGDDDGAADVQDNCPGASNPDQADRDRDRIGNACEILPPGDVTPLAGEVTVAAAVSGEVFVKLPARARSAAYRALAAQTPTGFVPLKGIASLPVGTVVDARKGRMALTTAADNRPATDRRHRLQTGRFASAIFAIRQARRRRAAARAVTDLALRTPRGRSNACGPGRKRPVKGIVRTFSGTAKGRFRTIGAASTTTVGAFRAATWIVQDTCRGTLTEVGRGTARVFDRELQRTVTVRAGAGYLARARLFGARSRIVRPTDR